MYKVSVIIPVYNCENYIENTILSIINQKLNEVEIILVDDGSVDNSLEKCRSIQQKHSNIYVYNQENKGPGEARNLGLKYARGEYITFVDSDDYIPDNTFKGVYTSLKKHDADLFLGNILCFDDVRQWHIPYMKDIFENYKEERFGNINEFPNIVKSASVCNKWFKASIIKDNKLNFHKKIKIAEDFLFYQQFLMNSQTIIIHDKDIYAYRLLKNKSLIRQADLDFFRDLKIIQSEVVKSFKECTNKIYDVKIYRNSLMRQLEFFIDSIFLKFDNFREEDYINLVKEGIEIFNLTPYIEIRKLDFRSLERYLLAVLFKGRNKEEIITFFKEILKKSPPKELVREGEKHYSYLIKYFPKYKKVLNTAAIIESKVEDAYINDNKIIIKGYSFVKGYDYSKNKNIKKTLLIEGKKKGNIIRKKIKNDYRTDLTYIFKNDNMNYDWCGYKPIVIDVNSLIDDSYEIYIEMEVDGYIYKSQLNFKLAEIKNKLKMFYIDNEREIFCRFRYGKILNLRIRTLNSKQLKKSKIRKIKRSLRYDLGLITHKKIKAFVALNLFRILKPYLIKKDIWLMGEREDTAQDNTYHLYKYLKSNRKDIKSLYLINKKSDDLKYIKKFGGIVYFNSIMHTVYLLACKFTINSYSERGNMYTKEYLDIVKYYPEYKNNKKVFLQHGVIGVSRVNHVLHKNRMGYDLFIVSSKFEQNHIVKEFGYSEDEVAITGLARWDNLQSEADKKKILFMPSWRAWIKSEEELLESDYFIKMISFLKNKNLEEFLIKENYELTFYPHYQTQKLINNFDFEFNENIKIIKQGEKRVQELINENYILITDYSTVAFDFAYSDKPVIFYQFDYNEFYSKHYNSGPINHKKHLFGHRVELEEELISIIVNKNFQSENFSNREKYIYKHSKGDICSFITEKIEKIIS